MPTHCNIPSALSLEEIKFGSSVLIIDPFGTDLIGGHNHWQSKSKVPIN